MSERCVKCFRPLGNCFCKHIFPFDPGIKFVFLMHPKEAKHQRTGTGRLSHLTLINSEILVGLDFTKNERLSELLCDEDYFPLLLYPGKDAWTSQNEGFAKTVGKKKLLVLIIDATWFCSRKIIEHSSNLMTIPRVSFSGCYRSVFTFKREPRPEYISTIESCYYLIKELQPLGLAARRADPEPLMEVFKQMIKFQIESENARIEGKLPSTHAYDWKYKKKRDFLL
ncbi:tRNA-uridine aminocarboxypropyltransferase [Treponema parvum]|uniref:tRNA-uridine aminocarboxypropyltransferase n=1 Tax=Treponema parvum TaxID=138851 RepID=UPI001AEC39DE|nr:tRNA-uridine aminocarboxypropyltransferase [Treponema parvum]QTQ15308.1 DTW domain-containing protein [Treponema parvum]